MAYVATHPGTSTIAPSDGSRTIIVHDGQPREIEEDGAENSDGSSLPTEGVLHLRAGTRSQPRVTWTEDVVDNEGMGKKKSKICCIYTKNRDYNDSSSDSDSSDSDSELGSDSGGARPGGRLGQRISHRHSHGSHPHAHDRDGEGGGAAMRDGDGTTTVQELSDNDYERNAYERQPGRKKGKKKDNAQSRSQ